MKLFGLIEVDCRIVNRSKILAKWAVVADAAQVMLVFAGVGDPPVSLSRPISTRTYNNGAAKPTEWTVHWYNPK